MPKLITITDSEFGTDYTFFSEDIRKAICNSYSATCGQNCKNCIFWNQNTFDDYFDNLRKMKPRERKEPLILISCPKCGSNSLSFRGVVDLSDKTKKTPVSITCEDCGNEGASSTTDEGAVNEWNSQEEKNEQQ